MSEMINAQVGSREYTRQFNRQAVHAGERAARMWIVRAFCAVLGSIFLIALVEKDGVSVASISSMLFIVECGSVALFGKSAYLFCLSGLGRKWQKPGKDKESVKPES